ncbi:MAG: hypothetical protein WC653_02440, partial [Candidatus Gracilibacteria bacterium]
MSLRLLVPAAVLLSLLWASPVFAAHFTSDIESGLIKANAIQTEHFQFEFSDIVKNQNDAN